MKAYFSHPPERGASWPGEHRVTLGHLGGAMTWPVIYLTSAGWPSRLDLTPAQLVGLAIWMVWYRLRLAVRLVIKQIKHKINFNFLLTG